MNRLFTSLVALTATYFLSGPAVAGPGHDHGDTKPTASGPTLPRFSAHSDLFEAVGVLGKDELVVFIDRSATNEPVLNATVELESGSVKAVGKFEAALGEYHFDGKPFQQTAVYPVTLTIKAGKETDLLTAELDVHGDEASATSSSRLPHTLEEHPIAFGVGLLLVLLAIVAYFVFLRKKAGVDLRNRSAA